jgi:hypothetical protein
MMKNLPDPPFLELGFYFGDQPEADSFACLVTKLMELGASLTGAGSAHRGPDIRTKSFASMTDQPLPKPVTVSADSLTSIFKDPAIRIVELAMKDPIGIAQNAPGLVSYVSISPQAALIDRHPLAVITEGEVFCGALRDDFKESRHKAGIKVYNRFRELVQKLEPAYAAVTIEYPLQCPADLRRDPRSLAFRDFFVSERYLGSRGLARVKEIFNGAFIEPITNGLYVSCNEDFNPEGRNLNNESAQWLSVDAAKLIAFANGPWMNN